MEDLAQVVVRVALSDQLLPNSLQLFHLLVQSGQIVRTQQLQCLGEGERGERKRGKGYRGRRGRKRGEGGGKGTEGGRGEGESEGVQRKEGEEERRGGEGGQRERRVE